MTAVSIVRAGPSIAALPRDRRTACEIAAARCADEPTAAIADELASIAEELPKALAAVEAEMRGSDAGEIIAMLTQLANRLGVDLPDPLALRMDARVMSKWPRDLWELAFERVWERFSYRRMPTAADFRAQIERELSEAQHRRNRLHDLSVHKLSVVEQRARWDAEARERHAREKAAESARLRDILSRQEGSAGAGLS